MPDKRAYLRTQERRQSLLDAAMRLFGREGLAGLTMAAVAVEAGVSRRLVYEHFSDLGDLYLAFFAERTALYQEMIDRAFHAGDGTGVDALMRVFQRMIQIPAEDLRVLRVIVAGVGPEELRPVHNRFKARVLERWTPFVMQRGVERDVAQALIWSLTNAAIALAELVCQGEIPAERATLLLHAVVRGAAGRAL